MWGALRRALRKTRALLTYTLAIETEYRAEIIIWMIAGSLPLIMMFVWMGLADAGPMGGYSPQDFAAYFLTVFLIRQVTAHLGHLRARPRDSAGRAFAQAAAPSGPLLDARRASPGGASGEAAFFNSYHRRGGWCSPGPTSNFRPATLALFAVSLAAVWMIRFNLLYSVGLLTFWTDQATALNSLIFTLYTVFSGMLIPIDFFSRRVERGHPLHAFSLPHRLSRQDYAGGRDGGGPRAGLSGARRVGRRIRPAASGDVAAGT